ncbi:hypothetical protein LWI28_012951 [Acer negundo]|uniref:NTF2 domain-containing protein n=1 Tax=Acer negundo TaxID=4023 RepID=A0AAD5I6M1_ACENE|nr:hypothetical protein LWI28_012951 [Acer negundo]
MALQAASPPSVQVVGNAFVEQYYHILHNSPELVYRFYQDSSVLSRPDSNGVMTSVTTMEISPDFFPVQWAQNLGLPPAFTKYVEDSKVLDMYPVNIVNNSHVVPSFSDPESARVPDPPAADHTTSHVEEDQNISEEVYEPSEHEIRFLDEKEVLESQSHEVEKDVSAMVELVPSSVQEDAPKKSYASIVKVTKGSSGPNKIYVPTNTAKVTRKKTENQPLKSATPASHSETSAPVSTNIPESSNAHDEAESCSIYIRNLPFNITSAELEVEFKKFGPIKQGGNLKFSTELEGLEKDVNDATNGEAFSQENSISNDDEIEELKKEKIDKLRNLLNSLDKPLSRCSLTQPVGSGRGRHSFERERFRNDNSRQHGNGGGRGYGRNEYGNWGKFSGQGWGSTRRGDDYQRGKGGSSGGPKQKAVISA